eukprot:g127.t1
MNQTKDGSKKISSTDRKECSVCCKQLMKASFSTSQWKKKITRTCKACFEVKREHIIAKHRRWATVEDLKADIPKDIPKKKKRKKNIVKADVSKDKKERKEIPQEGNDDAVLLPLDILGDVEDAKQEEKLVAAEEEKKMLATETLVDVEEPLSLNEENETDNIESDHGVNNKRDRTKSMEEQLREAARDGDKEKVENILKQNRSSVSAIDWGGWTSLFFTASHNRPEVAKLLISAGADVNHKDKDGWTALHAACYNGSEGAVRALLRAGAKVDEKDNDGQTPIEMAKTYGFSNISKMFEGPSGNKVCMMKNSPLSPLARSRSLEGRGRGRGSGSDSRKKRRFS